MPFDLDLLMAECRVPCAVRYMEEADSTVRVAWRWLEEGGPDGGVVIAGRQRAGQGRRGRTWSSPLGGLWMSVLSRPDLEVTRAGRLGMAMALAAAEGVEQVAGVEVGLKWPNDLMVENRKVAGVLVETRIAGDRVTAAVLSAGINAKVAPEDFPEALRTTAVSLKEVTEREFSLEVLAARVLDRLTALSEDLAGSGEELARGWQERDQLRGKYVHVLAGSVHLDGVCHGVDADGALRLIVAGDERRITVGEIDHLRPLA